MSRSGAVAGVLALFGIALLVALGVWQLERRNWKLQLIERVEQRVHAPVTAAPDHERWNAVNAAGDEYRHVAVTGEYLSQGQALVQALTRLGPGYWVMTPLRRSADGSIVLINRGFVPSELRSRPALFEPPAGVVQVNGLLRLSEPRGRLFRRNVPMAQRWYSRDIAAIAEVAGLHEVAPYFVDAEADAVALHYPVAGLTVVSFPNNHLLYALTWFSLSVLGAVTLAVGRRQPLTHAAA